MMKIIAKIQNAFILKDYTRLVFLKLKYKETQIKRQSSFEQIRSTDALTKHSAAFRV